MEHKKNISSATVNTNSTETSAFDPISDELLINIFSYLPSKLLGKVAKVSRKFRAVSVDNTLWKSRVNTDEENINFKQLYATAPYLRVDEAEFYAVGDRISVAKKAQGISPNFYTTPIKEFSSAEILNTFNQADVIFLFETESRAQEYVSNKTIFSEGNHRYKESTHVIFKIKLLDMVQITEIQENFYNLNESTDNHHRPDNKVFKFIPVVEKENIVVLSANLMNQHKYTFEQLNPKASRCLVM